MSDHEHCPTCESCTPLTRNLRVADNWPCSDPWHYPQRVGAPEGSREVRCALLSPHQPHGEIDPEDPDRNWWCPGVVVTW